MATTYTETTWSTGDIVTAALANNWEDGITAAHEGNTDGHSRSSGFSLDLQYSYRHNTKLIARCESSEAWEAEDWEVTGGSSSTFNTTYKKVGESAVNISAMAVGQGAHLVKALNLTTFTDGSTSADTDYICFIMYISAANYTNLHADGIRVRLHNDAEGTETNYKEYVISKASITSDAYTYFKIIKSDFTDVGTASWSGVTGISITLQGTTLATAHWTMDNFQLVRKDSLSATPNPLAGLNVTAGENVVAQEFGRIVWKDLNPAWGTCVFGSTNFKNFTASISNVVSGTYLNGIGWKTNTNLVETYIYNSILELRLNGTSMASVSLSVSAGDIVVLTLDRQGTTFKVTMVKNGDFLNISTLIAELGVSNSEIGYVVNSGVGTVESNCTNFTITGTIHSNTADISENTKNNAVLYQGGAFTTADLPVGKYGIDYSNHRIYVKYLDGTLKYATLT